MLCRLCCRLSKNGSSSSFLHSNVLTVPINCSKIHKKLKFPSGSSLIFLSRCSSKDPIIADKSSWWTLIGVGSNWFESGNATTACLLYQVSARLQNSNFNRPCRQRTSRPLKPAMSLIYFNALGSVLLMHLRPSKYGSNSIAAPTIAKKSRSVVL